MYLPNYHALTDTGTMHAHMEQHALGAWVCTVGDQLVANHVPFALDKHRGTHGRLLGHVSRANPVWRAMAHGVPSVVMFMGPSAYITPAWYPGKRKHGKVVPTWNYVTVHAHGVARAIEEPGWMLDMLNRVTDAQESRLRNHNRWRVSDAPADHIQEKLRAIVGIELGIDRLEGRLKISQDEDREDRLGTVEGLMRQSDTPARTLASMVLRELTIEEHRRKEQ